MRFVPVLIDRQHPWETSDCRVWRHQMMPVKSLIGKKADVAGLVEDSQTHQRVKYASAHDIRRGLAQRLINISVSGEALRVVMRHRDFAITEKHYGAARSAQNAGAEMSARLRPSTVNRALTGGGGD